MAKVPLMSIGSPRDAAIDSTTFNKNREALLAKEDALESLW